MKSISINGSRYQVYEIGRPHILVSKNGNTHIKFAARPNGALCFYLWSEGKWKPKYKYEEIQYTDVLDQNKILQFVAKKQDNAMTTEQLIKLAEMRDKAERIGKSSYERLSAEDMTDIIQYILDNDKHLAYRLKEIIRDSRKNMADKILMARQTTINFE